VNLNANKAAGLDYLSLIEFNPERSGLGLKQEVILNSKGLVN
jgi:hypothetical protein